MVWYGIFHIHGTVFHNRMVFRVVRKFPSWYGNPECCVWTRGGTGAAEWRARLVVRLILSFSSLCVAPFAPKTERDIALVDAATVQVTSVLHDRTV